MCVIICLNFCQNYSSLNCRGLHSLTDNSKPSAENCTIVAADKMATKTHESCWQLNPVLLLETKVNQCCFNSLRITKSHTELLLGQLGSLFGKLRVTESYQYWLMVKPGLLQGSSVSFRVNHSHSLVT